MDSVTVTHLIYIELIFLRLGLSNSYFGKGFASRAVKLGGDFSKYIDTLQLFADIPIVCRLREIYKSSLTLNTDAVLELLHSM